MAFDTHYPNRKDHRKAYAGPKAISRRCRNHGSCPHCRGNRTIADVRARQRVQIEDAE